MKKSLFCSLFSAICLVACATTDDSKNLILKNYQNTDLASQTFGGINTSPLRVKVEGGGINTSDYKKTTKIDSGGNGEILVK